MIISLVNTCTGRYNFVLLTNTIKFMKRFLLILVSCVILNTLSGCVNQRKKDSKVEYLKEYLPQRMLQKIAHRQ